MCRWGGGGGEECVRGWGRVEVRNVSEGGVGVRNVSEGGMGVRNVSEGGGGEECV